MDHFVPWKSWKIEGDPERRVALSVFSLGIIPSGSSARIELSDSTGKRIDDAAFQTGWRGDPNEATYDFSQELAEPVVVIHMQRYINGRDIRKEYFAVGADRIRFVRMENAKGEIFQNEYIYPNYEVGLAPGAKTVAEWIALLESKRAADVLSALIFLGG